MVRTKNLDMELTQEEFSEVINNSHKIVVVDFYAEWCMPCLIIAPIVDELSEEMNDVKFVKINIDDNRDLAGKHSIASIPCLVIFKDGKEIGRINGAGSKESIEEKIRGFLNSA